MDFENLVAANILRYQTTPGEGTAAAWAVPDHPMQTRIPAAMCSGLAAASAMLLLSFIPGVPDVLELALRMLGSALYVVTLIVPPVLGLVLEVKHERELNQASRRVPAGVQYAMARLASAAAELDGEDPDGHVTTNAALDTVRALVPTIGAHQAAGTVHTPAGQAVVGEVYRLAAQADAYLMLRRYHGLATSEVETYLELEPARSIDYTTLADRVVNDTEVMGDTETVASLTEQPKQPTTPTTSKTVVPRF